jgi:hypothetical protein
MLALIINAQQRPSVPGNIPDYVKKEMKQRMPDYLKHSVSYSEVKGTSVNDTIFAENFDNVTNFNFPEGWTRICGQGPFGDAIFLYNKRVTVPAGDTITLLATPSIDRLSDAKFLEFSSLGNGNNVMSIGYMTDSSDASTFTQIDTFVISNLNTFKMEYYHVLLNNIPSGAKYLAFQFTGTDGYFYLDDVLVAGDEPNINYPQRVKNMVVESGATGALSATVKWVNPTKELDGDAVTLTKAYLYLTVPNSWGSFMNAILIDSIVNPVAGGAESITIDNTILTKAQKYRFQVVTANTTDTSKTVTVFKWIGEDVPGACDTVILALENSQPKVTWTAPTEGAHGAYFDASSITNYVITRSDGVKDTVAGDVLEFIDTITDPDVYNYSVFAINASGNGLSKVSNALALAQGDYYLYDSYAVNPLTTGWTTAGVGKDNWVHKLYYGGVMDFAGTLGSMPSFPDGTSYLISPKLNTEGAIVLQLDFTAVLAYPFWMSVDPYEFSIQTTSDGGNTWHKVYSVTVDKWLPVTPYSILFSSEDVGSTDLQIAYCYTGGADDIYYMNIYNFAIKKVDGVDMSMLNVECPDVVKTAQKFLVEATFKNTGSIDTAFFITVDFVSNGVSQVSNTVKIDELTYGQDSTITFSDLVVPNGIYDVITYVTAPEDFNLDNDTIHKPLQVFNGIERNMVVIEDGTGTWCTFCPGAQMGIEDLKNSGYKVAGIAYHGGNDSYKISEGVDRLHYYGITSFPTTVFDGVTIYSGGSSISSMYDTYVPIVEDRMAHVTPIEFSIEDLSYDANNKQVKVTVLAKRIVDTIYIPDSLRVRLALTETNIDQEWQGLTKVNDVLRAMAPDSSAGAYIDLVANESVTVNATFTVDDTWVPELMEVSAFVQNERTKEILNADKREVKEIADKPDLTVKVVDYYNNPVQGATVIIDTKEYQTDANGEAVVADINPGGHLYSYSKDGFLPTYPARVIIDLDNKSVEEKMIEGEIIWGESFDSKTLSESWSFSDHDANWMYVKQASSGGAPYELLMYWNPQFNGTSALISPNVALKDMMNANDAYFFMLKYTVDDYDGSGGYKISGRMVSESNTDTTVYWQVEPTSDIGATIVMERMSYNDVTDGNVRFEYEFEGNTYRMNMWTIDDIWIAKLVLESVAPSAPANLTASDTTDSSVVLTWDASTDNVGVEGYYVYESDNVIDTVDATATMVTGLTSETEYTFTVRAFDAAENISDASNAVTITTLVGINSNVVRKVNIYPNPAKNTITVDGDIQGTLKIYSVAGKCLVTDAEFTSDNAVDVSNLEKGLYIINIETQKGVYTAKVNILK